MFLTEEQYKHVMGIIDKTTERGPLLIELQQWANRELDLLVLDYFCDYLDKIKPRIKIILWKLEEERKMYDGPNYDKTIQYKFQKQFASLARKYGLHTDFQCEQKIFVCYDTIRDEIEKRTLATIKDKIYELEGGDIWKIYLREGSVHIFYEKDIQILENEINGRSKETLDKKYDGSFYFYFS